MARNEPPPAPCGECGEPAKWLCEACMEEGDGPLCDAHAEDHVHAEEYGDPLPLLNSPRVGMCGYTGPDRPPY